MIGCCVSASVLFRCFSLGIPFCTFGLENIRYRGKLCNVHLRFWFVSLLLRKLYIYIYLLCDFGLISWYIMYVRLTALLISPAPFPSTTLPHSMVYLTYPVLFIWCSGVGV
jgi:hypothetical protein